MTEGDNPLEKEEVTDGQLSCLYHKLQSGQPPFVDMGVWGPHGDRIARAMRFVSQQWGDGQWKAVELPGAASLDAWEESWRIFRTGALMLQLATAATLDRYASEFRTRVLQHPDVWHLAAQADMMQDRVLVPGEEDARGIPLYAPSIVCIHTRPTLELPDPCQRLALRVLVKRV